MPQPCPPASSPWNDAPASPECAEAVDAASASPGREVTRSNSLTTEVSPAIFDTRPARRDPDSSWRQVPDALVCLAIAVIMFRAFLLEGYIISTGSMAPHLLGHHKRVECPDCHYQFTFGLRFDGDQSPRTQLATCPNCRLPAIDVSEVPRNEGDQLLVFKPACTLDDPQRWQVLVFLNPNHPDQAYVKRVVGLPGETVQVRDGDVWINGHLARKSLPQQRAVRLPLFDNDLPGQSASWIPRWLPERGWAEHNSVFSYTAATATAPLPGEEHWQSLRQPATSPDDSHVFSWVRYFHWPRLNRDERSAVVAGEPLAPEPITDQYGYNQPGFPHEREKVHDLMLSARVDLTDGGQFAAMLTNREQQAIFNFNADTLRLEVWIAPADADVDQFLTEGIEPDDFVPLEQSWFDSEFEIEVSTFDQQACAAINGVDLLEISMDQPSDRTLDVEVSDNLTDADIVAATGAQDVVQTGGTGDLSAELKLIAGRLDGIRRRDAAPYQRDDARLSPKRADTAASPVWFGVRGATAQVRSVRLDRDVHYTTSYHANGVAEPLRLGDDEYFFLGDNSPVSLDSRGWKTPVVNRRLIVGRPLVVHLPSRPGRLRFGRRITHFRIPDFASMRYIR